MKIKVTEVDFTTLEEVQTDVDRQVHEAYGERLISEMRAMFIAGLAEETGEVAGLFKRQLRGYTKDQNSMDRMSDELGDVLWYLTACCFAFGTTLEEIWDQNKKKLNGRGWRHE